jgi:long-chain acyl-CoA synthetase
VFFLNQNRRPANALSDTGFPRFAVDSRDVVRAFRGLLTLDSEKTLFNWREDGVTHHLTCREFRRACIGLKDRLIELGFHPEDRAAILSESSPQWAIAFLSSLAAGLIAVPVDARSTEQELAHILGHAAPSVIFVSRAFEARIALIRPNLPSVREVIVMDADPDGGLLALKESSETHRFPTPEAGLNRTAVIAYTSGTLGTPKGVMLTAMNLWSQVVSLTETFQSGNDDVMLSMLPINHLLELAGGLLTAMFTSARIVFANTLLPTELVELMCEHGVTRMITVPLFLDHLQRGIQRELAKQSALQRFAFATLLRLAPHLPFGWRRRLFGRLHRKFGGRLSLFIVGGAPLRREVAAFFEALGIRVLQGYGLTETSPVITVNRFDRNRLGSVGVPLQGVRVRIDRESPSDETGEVVACGPNVMRGYYRNEEGTREVLEPTGWFHTGDIGYLDPDGFLWLTGRKKNLIVLPGGKKVWPEEVEEALGLSPMFVECCVLGIRGKDATGADGERVVAVVRPDPAGPRPTAEAIEAEIAARTASLASFKRPSRTIVFDQDFPKTPTRKVKRKVLLELLTKESSP